SYFAPQRSAIDARPDRTSSNTLRNLRSYSAAGSAPWAGAGDSTRVCHERRARVLECNATQEMREEPSEPAYRRRLQTALSCSSKEPLWRALRKRQTRECVR